MRNLSLFRNVSTAFPDSAAISAVTVDLDQDILYVASEKENQDGDVNVAIWRTFTDSRIEFYRDTSSATLLATFTSPAYSTSNPWSVTTRPAEIVSFRLLPDSRNLVFIMRGGEIATANLEDETLAVEVVGSFESGILAASWSPDDTVLVLATGDAKLILMTPDFDVISETSLHPTDFGEDAPINVGWGSKQTQFHGSLGKAAAQAPKPQNIGSSPDDDQLPRITWRGDGAYFAVSSLSPSPTAETNKPELRHRTFRVYSHIGALQSTSEPTPGLEHVLSWRPSGNWIVSTQRYGFEGGGLGREGRHDLVMFERNGLRRSDFVIEKLLAPNQTSEHTSTVRKWGYRMREVSWSSDSNILSLWIEKNSGDIVQLWTIGNYHWYLKHEIVAPSGPHGEPGRLTSVIWHPEDATKLILTTPTHVIQRTFIWETNSSPSKPPQDSGSVAVLDGASILLTPFRSQNVPPPMSSYQLAVPFDSTKLESIKTRIPVNMSFSRERDIFALVWETGYVEVIDLHTRLVPGREKIMDPVKLWSGLLSPDSDVEYRQIVHWVSDSHKDEIVRIAALGTGSREVITILSIAEGEVKERANISISTRNGRLLSGGGQLFLQTPDGEILSLDVDSESTSPVSNFPEFCYDSHASQAPSKSDPDTLFIGLSQGGKLYAADSRANHLLAANANSFTLASGFLVYTTSAHVSHYAPLDALPSLLQQRAMNRDALPPMPEWETRRVERGSRIVTAVPSAMSLVLQMPRGNLETINPRPLVMKIVKQDIDRGQYAKAFSSCRRHRVDLNVFVEHNKDAFISNLASFVEQVDDVDYINLFLTSVGQGSMSPEVIAQVCDGVRAELEKKDLKKYVNSILTAHVVKQPPDHEAGLALLLRLRDTEPQVVEDAVKYIIFLVDADRLFDTALGMYDFSLVLMIAQHAQKDPREYLPFLRELRALEKFYQRFKIDDHLKRYEKALKNLSLTGDDHFDEAMDYVEKHQLYDAALSIWKETNHYDTVLSTYGDWLFERREFRHAGFVFTQAQKYEKAMVAYEKALDWQELFALAVQQQASEEDLADMAYRVAEDLSSKKRYQEAARVLLDYRQDVRGAIFALVQGNQFSEARRLITLHHQSDLLEDVVYPAALESRSQLSEELSEMKDQLRKQLARLRELRVKKVEEPDAFFGVEDTDLHNVDVMTDISMAPTAFTRYTVAASAMSKTSSKRSSRSKRKLERKVGSGRKGTVDEEEYLLKSVTKLVGKFNNAQTDAVNLLPHLFQFTEKHCEEGLELQQEIVDFAQELQLAVEEIWKKVEREGEPTTPEGWAARMQEIEKQRQIDPLDKVAKPELTKRDWNTKLSSL